MDNDLYIPLASSNKNNYKSGPNISWLPLIHIMIYRFDRNFSFLFLLSILITFLASYTFDTKFGFTPWVT